METWKDTKIKLQVLAKPKKTKSLEHKRPLKEMGHVEFTIKDLGKFEPAKRYQDIEDHSHKNERGENIRFVGLLKYIIE